MELFAAAGLSEASGWDIVFLVGLVTVVPLLGTAAIYLLIVVACRAWNRHNKPVRIIKRVKGD